MPGESPHFGDKNLQKSYKIIKHDQRMAKMNQNDQQLDHIFGG
jgi:hypothetical protein